jgi:hypothetical protein
MYLSSAATEGPHPLSAKDWHSSWFSQVLYDTYTYAEKRSTYEIQSREKYLLTRW